MEGSAQAKPLTQHRLVHKATTFQNFHSPCGGQCTGKATPSAGWSTEPHLCIHYVKINFQSKPCPAQASEQSNPLCIHNVNGSAPAKPHRVQAGRFHLCGRRCRSKAKPSTGWYTEPHLISLHSQDGRQCASRATPSTGWTSEPPCRQPWNR